MKRQIFLPILILTLLLLVTFGIILYGQGYRLGTTSTGGITASKTGLLVTTSIPDGAQVSVNGNLTTATNNTINLLPGKYAIKIEKEGYFPWQKEVEIQKGVVTKADALLFPTAPRLENITSNGVENPVLDPSGTRIVFRVSSQSAQKRNGLYILDMNSSPILTLQSSARQIVDDSTAIFSASTYSWSPDGQQLVATISGEQGLDLTYLLKSNSFNDNPQNITAVLNLTQDRWEADKAEKELARMNSVPKLVRNIINSNFQVLSWSPDDEKILYVASRSAELPLAINPRHIGIDTQREDRKLKKGDLYVYDIQDDVNYKVFSSPDGCVENGTECFPVLHWLTDSEHLLFVQDKKINVMEVDVTNRTVIYAGPFVDNFVFPWPNGSKIVMLTNFNNSTVSPNLYTIGLK